MVVTMSTVGYGDIHPVSGRGRAIVSCIIITAWVLVPIQISKLYEVRVQMSPSQYCAALCVSIRQKP